MYRIKLKTILRKKFSNEWIALGILLTTPITDAFGERIFSKLVNAYLKSTMGDERLSTIAVLSIKNDIAENFDWTTLANEFVEIKARKCPLKL